jgi:hypothetical protein
MNRRTIRLLRTLAASALLALGALAVPGCSGDSAGVASTDAPFTKEELADLRKSARNQGEFRELIRQKIGQQQGMVVVKKKLAPRRPRARP